jgi:hypothetical protein
LITPVPIRLAAVGFDAVKQLPSLNPSLLLL